MIDIEAVNTVVIADRYAVRRAVIGEAREFPGESPVYKCTTAQYDEFFSGPVEGVYDFPAAKTSG